MRCSNSNVRIRAVEKSVSITNRTQSLLIPSPHKYQADAYKIAEFVVVVVPNRDVVVLITVISVVVVFIKIVILWTCLEGGRTQAGVSIVEINGDVMALVAPIGTQMPPTSPTAVAVRIATSTFSFLVFVVTGRTLRVTLAF